ncbi:MAG: hypothetical protein QNJ13_09170 [Paracoccaceae bacterium]|nr:hypothetical protein [Paracoccaceae bacterium]
MGALRALLILSALCLAPPARAEMHVDLVRVFSQCAGAYMAELERAWLFGDPETDRLHRERRHIVAVLDALTPEDRHREALSLRAEARAAHGALLREASFAPVAADAERAQARAALLIGHCRGLILKS